jgi:hypothetical protein
MILTCRQLAAKATDQRGGRLSAVDRAGWATHLAWCSRCRTFLAQLDATVTALHGVAAPAAPPSLRTKILKRR